jgi:hypothetical protein
LQITATARNRRSAARVDERPDAETERHEVERRLEKAREERTAPDPAIDDRVALDDAQGSSHVNN